jgi:hypothetical protein
LETWGCRPAFNGNDNATKHQDHNHAIRNHGIRAGGIRPGAGHAAQVGGGRPISPPGRSAKKSSYATYEAAEKAGLVIKNEHPILQVAVYDGVESVNKIIELP